MQYDEIKALSSVRFDHAKECLATARSVLELGDYKSAANRSYYAIFHAIRAVLAFDGIDMRHHSGVISEFRRLYIKTGVFDKDISEIISMLFDLRTDCDYNDFFVIAKEEIAQQIENAEYFCGKIQEYLKTK